MLGQLEHSHSRCFFFFKQKTAYEIVDCDWSSDVCSSDLKLPEDIQFTSTGGEVTAQTEAVEAGHWMNMSGSLATDGGKAGIVIMAHSDNPLPNNQWILRTKNSMQNPVYPGREPVLISTEEPTILRYRLVIYHGDLPDKEIDHWYEELK